MALFHKDWELPNARIWLAEIGNETNLDFVARWWHVAPRTRLVPSRPRVVKDLRPHLPEVLLTSGQKPSTKITYIVLQTSVRLLNIFLFLAIVFF